MRPEDIILRYATDADADSIADLYLTSRKTFLPYASLAHSDDSVRRWIREVLPHTHDLVIAEVDGVIAGMLATALRAECGWVDQLYVHPSIVSQGVGTRLMREAKEVLGPLIRLYTFQENTAARRFYERHGFRAIQFSAGHGNESGCPDVLYELDERGIEIDFLADHPELVEPLAAWHQEEWGHLRPEETVAARADKLRGWAGRHEIPTVLVAIKNGVLLGSAMLKAHDMDNRPDWTPWLAGVVVGKEHRQQGVGALLVDRAVAEAKAQGHAKLYLYTFGNQDYYARRGAVPVEQTQYFAQPVHVLRFDLDH